MTIPPTGTAEQGLRERKREDTRRRLEVAAVDIALERGFENATVDAISEAANVSPRTFFNYFESKEDAILGTRDHGVAERIGALDVRVPNETLVESIMRLLVAAFEPGLDGHELQKKRMQLAKLDPNLFTRQLGQLGRMGDHLTHAVLARVEASGEFADRSVADRRADAELLLALCGGAFRIAMKEWIAAGGRASTHDLELRAAALVNDLRKRLK